MMEIIRAFFFFGFFSLFSFPVFFNFSLKASSIIASLAGLNRCLNRSRCQEKAIQIFLTGSDDDETCDLALHCHKFLQFDITTK